MSGYVRLHRTLIGHPAFRNDAEAMAFAWMVARAAWKPARVRYKERAICLRRGQLALSIRDFAHSMDRDKAWVERLLKRLKSEAMIETQLETGVTVITICNYGQFQGDQDKSKTADKTLDETDARQGQDTEQGREEDKKEDIPPNPRKRGNGERSILSEDWAAPLPGELPPKARACAEQWTTASYETHAEAFCAYWRSERKMKADWRGTWANRVIDLHSKVMRDQKFGNAPTDAKLNASARPMSANDLRNAIRFRRDSGDEAGARRYEADLAALDAPADADMARAVAALPRIGKAA